MRAVRLQSSSRFALAGGDEDGVVYLVVRPSPRFGRRKCRLGPRRCRRIPCSLDAAWASATALAAVVHVVEGRDIRVPDVRFKIFLTASPEVRAQRRQRAEARVDAPINDRRE